MHAACMRWLKRVLLWCVGVPVSCWWYCRVMRRAPKGRSAWRESARVYFMYPEKRNDDLILFICALALMQGFCNARPSVCLWRPTSCSACAWRAAALVRPLLSAAYQLRAMARSKYFSMRCSQNALRRAMMYAGRCLKRGLQMHLGYFPARGGLPSHSAAR